MQVYLVNLLRYLTEVKLTPPEAVACYISPGRYSGKELRGFAPILQILNTPVEPIHGTSTRGSGLNRLINLTAISTTCMIPKK